MGKKCAFRVSFTLGKGVGVSAVQLWWEAKYSLVFFPPLSLIFTGEQPSRAAKKMVFQGNFESVQSWQGAGGRNVINFAKLSVKRKSKWGEGVGWGCLLSGRVCWGGGRVWF